MSGAKTARRLVVQRRNGGAEMALPLFLGLAHHQIVWDFFPDDFLDVIYYAWPEQQKNYT